MSSLKDRIELLESDLTADPPRINVYKDLPFAILRYDPQDEWTMRREARLLATRLEETGCATNQIMRLASWEKWVTLQGTSPLGEEGSVRHGCEEGIEEAVS